MLPKRDCRLGNQFLSEDIETLDTCRFPRLTAHASGVLLPRILPMNRRTH
jgi:hypothetical protein